MAFQIQCTNKGCREYQQPVLDIDKGSETHNEVICSLCHKPIENVSPFHKTTMKHLGQVKRTVTAKQAYSVTCDGCKRGDKPILHEGKIACKHCGAEHKHLSKPFVHALMLSLQSK